MKDVKGECYLVFISELPSLCFGWEDFDFEELVTLGILVGLLVVYDILSVLSIEPFELPVVETVSLEGARLIFLLLGEDDSSPDC